MSSFAIPRKAVALLASVTVLAGGLAASNAAEAKPFWTPKPFPGAFHNHGPRFGGYGYGAVAFAGGLALGAIAAAESENACYVVRQRMIDDDGNEYFARVRVCE